MEVIPPRPLQPTDRYSEEGGGARGSALLISVGLAKKAKKAQGATSKLQGAKVKSLLDQTPVFF